MLTRLTHIYSPTMLQEGIQFLKSKLEEFQPWWTWKIPVVKEKSQRAQHQNYHKIASACRISQFCLAVFAIFMIASLYEAERSRQLLISTVIRKGFCRFIMGILIFTIIGYLLGLKRFPGNYIPLVIIQTIMQLEERFMPDLYKFQVKVLGHSKKGHWSVVTASPKVAPSLLPAFAENAGLLIILLVGLYAFCKYTDFDLSKYHVPVLISQTVTSSCAAVLLLAAFAFDEFPEFKETHRKFCERWIILAVITLLLVMAFLSHRLQDKIRGKLKWDFSYGIEWDCFIYILTFSLVVRYMPTLHKGFNVKYILSKKTSYLLEAVVPNLLLDVWLKISK